MKKGRWTDVWERRNAPSLIVAQSPRTTLHPSLGERKSQREKERSGLEEKKIYRPTDLIQRASVRTDPERGRKK